MRAYIYIYTYNHQPSFYIVLELIPAWVLNFHIIPKNVQALTEIQLFLTYIFEYILQKYQKNSH